jgi:hypothetical protein
MLADPDLDGTGEGMQLGTYGPTYLPVHNIAQFPAKNTMRQWKDKIAPSATYVFPTRP